MKQCIALVALRAPSLQALAAITALSGSETIAVSIYEDGGDPVYMLACRQDSPEDVRILRDIDDLGWRDDLDAAKTLPEVWLTNSIMEKPVLGRFGDYLLMQNTQASEKEDAGKVYRQWMILRDFDILPIPSGSLVIPDRWRYSLLITNISDHSRHLLEAIVECIHDLGFLPEDVDLVSCFGERYDLTHHKSCLPKSVSLINV